MSRLRTIRLLALSLWLSLSLQAQQYVFHVYRQAEGLKNIAINGMARDRDGFLWLATENGVYRFLGASFKQFGPEQGIAELDVRDIVADPEGTVWVGTDENLYRWDGVRFLPAGREPIPIGGARHIAVEDSRHLLVIDNGRLYRLEHDDEGRMLSYISVIQDGLVDSIPDLGHISSVSVLAQPFEGNRIWVGCSKKLYSMSAHPIDNRVEAGLSNVMDWGREKGLPADQWQSVLIDRTGDLWAAGPKHVAEMPHGTKRFVDRSIPGSDQDIVFGRGLLLEDSEGRMLVPASVGVARWTGTGWQLIGQANGLKSMSNIVGMAFDGAGDLSLAIRGDGLYQWAGYKDWEGWDDKQGLPSGFIWTIAFSNKGKVFVGTDRGPAWIDPVNGTAGPLSTRHRWDFGHVSGMGFNSDGSLWGATHSGAILRIDSKTGAAEQTARVSASIYAAFQDARGRVFFFTRQGVVMREAMDVKAVPHNIPAAEKLLGSSAIVQSGCGSPDGTDWFVGDNRIVSFKNGQWKAPPIDGLTIPRGTLLGLFCAQDGSIWATGDQTGTWQLTPTNGRMKAWRLDPPAELRSLASLTVLKDRRGWLWLGTDMGLLVWNGNAWRHLTQESGLIWNDTDQGVLQEAPDGSLWVGTSGGVAHVMHPEWVFDASPLRVSVTAANRGEQDLTALDKIVLPWAGIPLRLQVSSPATRDRSELVFKYRMDGLQSDWIESQDGVAVYSDLPPGTYTFTAIASNPGLGANSAPVQVQVVILPPWWRTDWFYILCAMALVIVVAGADRLRATYLGAKSRELEKTIRERTRELELSREQLRIQATHDALTGMLNRAGILRRLEIEKERARKRGKTTLIALVDLDYFKRVNDDFGHPVGDEALRCFASAITAAVRRYDHVGRYGGEEFLLVLSDVPLEAAQERLAAIHDSVSNLRVKSGDLEMVLNCSIGGTVFDPKTGPSTNETLLSLADQALYAAKSAGRNRVVFRAPFHPDLAQSA